MNFLKILNGRHAGNSASDEAVFEDRSIDLVLSRLACHVRDHFPCVACHDDGNVHYDVPPFVSKFTTVQDQEHVMAVADEDGMVSVFDTCQNAAECCVTRFRAHNNTIFDICWVDNEKKLMTVSGDKTAILWDIPKQREISVFEGHTRSIKTVDFRPGDTAIFATGARDGDIMIWDKRCQKRGRFNRADNVIKNAHLAESNTPMTLRTKKKKQTAKNELSLDGLRSVTAVVFQDENTLISSGCADGTIKVWDLRKNYAVYRKDPLPKFTLPYAGKCIKATGYSNLLLDSSGTRLFASCTDDVIYQFNSASYAPEPVSAYFGHKNSTFFVKSALCPREKYIVSGSSDKNAFIWKIDKPGLPLYRLSGHSAEVTSVDWCKDPYDQLKLVTCCDDTMVRIWRPKLANGDIHSFQGKCKKFKPKLDKIFDSENPNYWMSRVKYLPKCVINRSCVSECGSDNVQNSSKSSCVTDKLCLKRLHCTDLRTPKIASTSVCSVDQRLVRPKRTKFDLENCTISPLITNELERTNTKRPLTGKCLFADGDDDVQTNSSDSDTHIQKKRKMSSSQNAFESSPARSPFKNITWNENSPKRTEDVWSPTSNLPNSVTDKQNAAAVRGNQPNKPANDGHWLSKLSNLKRKKKNSKEDLKQPDLGRKKVKTPQMSQQIKKYFSAVPSSV